MSDSQWWHGGPKVFGSMILPPDVTGFSNSGSLHGVYVSTVRSLAVSYASSHLDPWVYLVVPRGEILPDLDSVLPEGQSCRCTSARIVKRFKVSNAEAGSYRRLVAFAQRSVSESDLEEEVEQT